jgi:hypothetical protein
MRQPHRNARRSNQRRRRAAIAFTLAQRDSLRHFHPGLRSAYSKAFERKPGERSLADSGYGQGLAPAMIESWWLHKEMVKAVTRYSSLEFLIRDERKSEILSLDGGGNQQPASLTQ